MTLGPARTSPPEATPTSKDASIQALRGLALILMVAGHVIGDTPERGLRAGDGTFLREAYLLLDDVRMPFFTLLSGYVYALRPMRPGRDGALRRFMRGKVRRLLVPMVVVGLAFMVVQRLVPGTNTDPEFGPDIVRLLLFGYEHLWFLQAVFLVFLVVALLDVRRLMDTPRGWSTVLGVGVVLFVLVQVPAPFALFSINQATHLFPFFLLGLGLARFADRAPSSPLAVLGSAIVLGLLLSLDVLQRHTDTDVSRPGERILQIGVGLSGVLLLYGLREVMRCRPLAWLGEYSYGAYLLHVFGTAGARVALERAGVESIPVLFLGGLVAGVAVPIAVELTLGRIPLVATLVFGRKWTGLLRSR